MMAKGSKKSRSGQCVDDGVATGRYEDEDLREHVGDDQHVQLADHRWSDAGTLLVMVDRVMLLGNGDPL